MGVINVTPDSFYDGGKYLQPHSALSRALQLLGDGADIIDMGAESTRPGAMPVETGEERKRLLPALELILSSRPHALISVDTRSAAAASAALDAGAVIINDVSAARHDSAMLDVLIQYKPGYVLMHSGGDPRSMQQDPQYDDVVAEVTAFFENGLNRLAAAGIPEDRIVLDPGIGFGKTPRHNLALLDAARTFAQFGRPLLVGISNKSFLGKLFGLGLHDRENATVNATVALAARGYQWHRLHNVKEAATALERAKLRSAKSIF